jgi:hypothetical protein
MTRSLDRRRNGYLDGEPPRCEGCGHFIERGQFVHCYDDVGEVHHNCEHPFSSTDVSAIDPNAGPVYVLLGQPLQRFRVSLP